ncbi:unnamed protein product [Caenorhabditis brenneri]
MSDIVSRLLTRHSGAEDQRELQNELMLLPAETQYEEFTRSFIRIHITSNVLNGRNIHAGYKGALIHPIYIDKESSPFFLRNGTKTAFLNLFDVRSRQVLLWRIDEMSPAEIEDVKDILGTLARTREFMSYGHEDFFARFDMRDIQRKHVPTGPPTICEKTKSIILHWIMLSCTMSMLGTLLTG